jgi:flagellar hook-length control protein FliK
MSENTMYSLAARNAQENTAYDSSNEQEGHVAGRMYIMSGEPKMVQDEMHSMSGQQAVNNQEILLKLADNLQQCPMHKADMGILELKSATVVADNNSSFNAILAAPLESITAPAVEASNFSFTGEHQTCMDKQRYIVKESSVPLASEELMSQNTMYSLAAHNAQENTAYDSSNGQEGHVAGRMYIMSGEPKIVQDEMHSMSGQQAVNNQEILLKLADSIKVSLSSGRSEIEVRLKPQELGRIVVKVAMESGAVSVKVTAESQMLKDFIQSRENELRALLEGEGYNLARLDVNIGQGYQQPLWDNARQGEWLGSFTLRNHTMSSAQIQHNPHTNFGIYYNDGLHQFDCFA